MRVTRFAFVLAGPFIGNALAQGGAWAQCGGIGFTGATTCVSGYTCVYLNDWYSQCVPGSATTTTSQTPATTTTSTTSATSSSGTGGKFKWFGLDESGAEWGSNIPGTWGVDYIWPSTTTIQTLLSEGYNIFRISFMMERMMPSSLTGTLDTAYLQNLTVVVNYVTSNGGWAVLDAHNYGRYYSNVITDTSGFQNFWNALATNFNTNSKVIFDTNNEYHDMDQDLVFNLNQAAINGIRAAGATSQYIFIEGNSWTGAWTWNTTNTNLGSLVDPQNKLVYEMHQYLDSDGSGSSPSCVSSDVGVQRVVGATTWLRQNGKLGVLGEYAGGPSTTCMQAITGMLNHMQSNSDVWTGAMWWAAGPWWGTSTTYSYEPPSGEAYVYYGSTLKGYTP